MITAALLVLSIASAANPCVDATPECRAAARDAIVTWRTSYEVCVEDREALERRLDVRTATGSVAISQTALLPVECDCGPSFGSVVAIGAGGVLIGVLAVFLVRGL